MTDNEERSLGICGASIIDPSAFPNSDLTHSGELKLLNMILDAVNRLYKMIEAMRDSYWDAILEKKRREN